MNDRMLEERSWSTRRVERWLRSNTYGAGDLPGAETLVARKRDEGARIAVVLPALNEEETIGAICRSVSRRLIGEVPLVDRLLVIDGGSEDGTAAVARSAGATVVASRDILPQIPTIPGKGESLWRSLAVADADIVVWIDADIRNFQPSFVTRLVAPLLLDRSTQFVKAFYRRPIAVDGEVFPAGGGRVTELLARPLLNAMFPELGGFIQPLSGEYAGRVDVLERLPFFSGYGVEAGLLIDLLEEVGLDAMAQVDLEERVHRNRPLEELSPMAWTIARAILRRAEERGRLKSPLGYEAIPLLYPGADRSVRTYVSQELERPPIALLPRPEPVAAV